MDTFKKIIEARAALQVENAKRQREYEEWCVHVKVEFQDLYEKEALLAGGLDLERLNHGRLIIYITGDYRKVGGEAASCLADAKSDIASGAPRLKQEFFGVKNYDRFYGQRSDHHYGCGPTHGHIVFAIGLKQEARKLEFTSEMIEDALYLLANIDKVLDAKPISHV